jgi:hypothetical protein
LPTMKNRSINHPDLDVRAFRAKCGMPYGEAVTPATTAAEIAKLTRQTPSGGKGQNKAKNKQIFGAGMCTDDVPTQTSFALPSKKRSK